MPTVEELGRRLKAKFPDYADLSDAEAGRLVKAKYPGQYDDFTDTAATLFEPQQLRDIQTVTNEITDLDIKIQGLKDYYRPYDGFFSSWWGKEKSTKRAELLASLNAEQEQVIKQWQMHHKAVREDRQMDVAFKVFVAQNARVLFEIQQTAVLLEAAANAGYTVENHQLLKLSRDFSDIKVDEHERIARINFEIEKEKAEHENKIEKDKAHNVLNASERAEYFRLKSDYDENLRSYKRELAELNAKTNLTPSEKSDVEHLETVIKETEVEKDALRRNFLRSSNGEETP